MENTELSKALFTAFENDDAETVRSLCSPDMRISQNNGPPMDLDTLLAFSHSVHRVLRGFRYEDAIRSRTETGFVEEHDLRGRLPDDSELSLAGCVVAVVSDGKVRQVREYFDGAAAAGLIKALSSLD